MICDNFETARDMSLNINHYTKLLTGFRLVPTSVTLNDLKRRISPYFSVFYRI